MWYMITVSLCSIALGEDFEKLKRLDYSADSVEFHTSFR